MKKSIQSKIISIILVGILFSSLTIGGLGIVSFHKELDKAVISTMNLSCEEKAQELNTLLGRIEQSAEVMAVLTQNYISDIEVLKDEQTCASYIAHLQDAAYNIASNTNGAFGIYVRINPEISGPTTGFYWLEDPMTGELTLAENTNILDFDSDDYENVGWYYKPVEAKKAVWLDPYESQKNHQMIVSYAMPIYKDGELLGVAGVDIDWSYITNAIDAITPYETGFAFLMDEEFTITYSKSMEAGKKLAEFNAELGHLKKTELIRSDRVFEIDYNGSEKTVAFTELNSGKIMAIIVPTSELNADFYALVGRIVCLALLTSAVFVFITLQMAKTIIRPLKQLNEAAKDLVDGRLDVNLNIKSNDELGTLASSINETAHQLKIRIDYINNLAYTDKLTGIKNSTAYLQEVTFLKNDILQKKADFAIFIIDVNGLKLINDTYGHELGNELIIKTTQMIAEVFGQEYFYRIGGDEFAVIKYNATRVECEVLSKTFMETVENQKGKLWASASIGYAIYNSKSDTNYESVFNRADEDMYENKVCMKEAGKTSRLTELS